MGSVGYAFTTRVPYVAHRATATAVPEADDPGPRSTLAVEWRLCHPQICSGGLWPPIDPAKNPRKPFSSW